MTRRPETVRRNRDTGQQATVGDVRRSATDATGRRIIDQPEPARPQVPAWISGVIAAVQAFAWSWGLLTVPAVAAFVSAAAQVTTQDSWRSAVGVASRLWLLGHGGVVSVSGAEITLMPLGVTLIGLISIYLSARRASRHSVTALIVLAGGYTTITVLVALSVGALSPRLVMVTVAVALGGGATGFRGKSGMEKTSWTLPAWLAWWKSPEVRAGMAGGGAALAATLGIAAIMVTLWAFAGRATASDIIASLDPDTIGGIVLGGAQLTYLFTLLIWAVSWLTGVGFHVGVGSEFAPAHAVLDPLPAIPLLSSLPTGDMAGGYTTWLIALVGVAGVIGGIVLWRRLRRTMDDGAVTWRQCAVALAAAVACVLIVLVIAFWLTTGSIGPGRLATAGPAVFKAAVAGTLLVGLGAAAAVVFLHPWLRTQVRAAFASVRGGKADDSANRR